MMSGYLSREPVLQAEGFVGRQIELVWLADLLGRPSPQNCNLIGEPRSGKSSLLMQVAARRLGTSPEQVGLYVVLRLAELPDHQAYTFWREMASRLDQAQQAAGLGMELDTAVPTNGDDRALFDALDEGIELLLEETACHRIFFLIDDFDLMLRGFTSRDLDWLRALATRYAESLAFVITSSDSLVRLMDRLLHREEIEMQVSSFANTFYDRALALLLPEEAVQLCQETAVAEGQSSLSPAELEFLLQDAGRHPALLKMALGYLFEARQYEKAEKVLPTIAGDMRLDEQVSWLCRQLWLRRTAEEQAVLAALAQDGQGVEPILLNRLRKQVGVVEERDGRATLFAGVFAWWVQREIGQSVEVAVNSSKTGEFTYLPEKRLLYVDDREVSLTSLEGRLLEYLLAHKNQVCQADELLAHVWGDGKTRSVVEKAINRLRLKVEADPKRPRFLLSARGEGYLLRLE
ncbi:MAG TPA: winged helix-turn-helix domain-containing protein [Chloroflexota bacterium]|nr:winged helix-turn-helix domain-containing protein [Chloroflexota bacterium]HUM72258.1 winged helix-turn-helix domain-containing protein [Chloroflexota bacterium]